MLPLPCPSRHSFPLGLLLQHQVVSPLPSLFSIFPNRAAKTILWKCKSAVTLLLKTLPMAPHLRANQSPYNDQQVPRDVTSLMVSPDTPFSTPNPGSHLYLGLRRLCAPLVTCFSHRPCVTSSHSVRFSCKGLLWSLKFQKKKYLASNSTANHPTYIHWLLSGLYKFQETRDFFCVHVLYPVGFPGGLR